MLNYRVTARDGTGVVPALAENTAWSGKHGGARVGWDWAEELGP